MWEKALAVVENGIARPWKPSIKKNLPKGERHCSGVERHLKKRVEALTAKAVKILVYFSHVATFVLFY